MTNKLSANQGYIMRTYLLAFALAALLPATGFCLLPYYSISVVDKATGRGIPGVELKTTNAGLYYTDSNGVAAFNRPDLMGKTVYFFLSTPGYSYPKDGFGFAGKALATAVGTSVTLTMTRDLAAQRMYRVTGPGVYRDSVLLHRPAHATQDASNSPIMTQFSGDTILYKNKMFWLGNDTNLVNSPNANRKGACATSLLPTSSSLDQEAGVSLTYFRQNEAAKPAFDFGSDIYRGDGLRIAKDPSGAEVLCANYYRLSGSLGVLERGVASFDEAASQFVKVAAYPSNALIVPEGFSFKSSEGRNGYVYSGSPWPNVRCLPEAAGSASYLSSYQALTCLKAGSRLDYTAGQMDRTGGVLRWSWATNTSPVSDDDCTSLIKKGLMTEEERWQKLLDVDSSTASVKSGAGTVVYNEYRQRWISIRGEKGGKTACGEVWYFEGDTNLGPWVYGRKIVTHFMVDGETTKSYSFLNPFHHQELDKDGGRKIFFDGTFTIDQGSAKFAIPRYNGNRMMYMLDLADARLALPVPVYSVEGSYRTKADIADPLADRVPVFFALDRASTATIPTGKSAPIYGYPDPAHETFVLSPSDVSPTGQPGSVVFYAVRGDATYATNSSLARTVALYEYVHETTQKRIYSTQATAPQAGYTKSPSPVCRVWPNPIRFNPYELIDRSTPTDSADAAWLAAD